MNQKQKKKPSEQFPAQRMSFFIALKPGWFGYWLYLQNAWRGQIGSTEVRAAVFSVVSAEAAKVIGHSTGGEVSTDWAEIVAYHGWHHWLGPK